MECGVVLWRPWVCSLEQEQSLSWKVIISMLWEREQPESFVIWAARIAQFCRKSQVSCQMGKVQTFCSAKTSTLQLFHGIFRLGHSRAEPLEVCAHHIPNLLLTVTTGCVFYCSFLEILVLLLSVPWISACGCASGTMGMPPDHPWAPVSALLFWLGGIHSQGMNQANFLSLAPSEKRVNPKGVRSKS